MHLTDFLSFSGTAAADIGCAAAAFWRGLCSLLVTAQLHCNQPQPGSSETQILHKSRQRAAPPVALVHIWRLNPSTGGDADAGGTPRRTRCCHLDPRQRLSGLRWTCPRGEGVCGYWFGTVRAKYTPRVTRSNTAARARPRFDPSPARTCESLPLSYVG